MHPLSSPVPVSTQTTDPPIGQRSANSGSELGRIICAATSQPARSFHVDEFEPLAITECFEQPRYTSAHLQGLHLYEIVDQRDYLAELHRLSDFPTYQSAPTNRRDEPVFARGNWKPVVEHKTFGTGTLLKIKAGANGIPVFDVQFLDGERTVRAYWLTGIEELLERWWHRKVKNFSFPDGSPDEMDKVVGGFVSQGSSRPVYVGCGYDSTGPACLRRGVEPRFNQVTPEDVASSQWKHVVGIEASQSVVRREPMLQPDTNFCPNCKYVAMGHDGPQGISCEEYIAKRDEKAKQHAAKAAKTLEEYCAEWKAKRERKQLAILRESQRYVYSPEEFDRDILISRGTVTADALKQFDRDHSRKGNKYRIQ